MRPAKVDIKGPVGKDHEGNVTKGMPEPQEYCEENGEHKDFVGDNEVVQDPTTLKAPEDDHTPNHTRAPKSGKPGYGKFEGRGNGGVGL